MGGRSRSDHNWKFAEAIVYPALAIAPTTFLSDIRKGLSEAGVPAAVARHDDAPIFDWIMSLVPLQGISDANAMSYARSYGYVRWVELEEALRDTPSCPKLRSYWGFHACGFKRASWSCSEPDHLLECPLPMHPLRKGLLNQGAYSLFLFLRDVCEGDFVSWIDERLRATDNAALPSERGKLLRAALLDPLRHIVGVSDKLWSMILADLLLGADPLRERWVSTGSTFVAVDSLVHAFLHRTGILRRFEADHSYGSDCYAGERCASIIEGLASRIDASELGDGYPSYFPRFIQQAIWRFCAQDVLNVCNANRIDDRTRCANWCCPVFKGCDRVSSRWNEVPGTRSTVKAGPVRGHR